MRPLRDVDYPANQPPPLVGYDVYGQDAALVEAVGREGGAAADGELRAFGLRAGSDEAIAWGVQANANPPVLRTHDRYGARIDEVEYHPAYHELMRMSIEHGLHARPWRDAGPGAHVVRAAGFVVGNQVDAGHLCPISMTYSSVPALRAESALADEWESRITADEYDPRSLPASEKAGVLVGMAMTEKQGGSDVRANTTRAEPIAGESGEFVLTGHKWFCSAPMCDAFLVLAQAPGGLTCFWLPRWTPDGGRNAFRIQRLKDKLGNRSNASSEVEFHRAWARRIGEEGRGVRAIIEMVNHTRLDCVLGATGNMRQALAQATHHATHRQAFGRELVDQPLMTNVLADLALESEAATSTALRLARAYDAHENDEETQFRRLATAVVKYWTCKRQTAHIAESLECLGGNGYVEESLMPRLLRESPLNGIWEGSGNVMCLDVLRAIVREPASVDALFAEVDLADGGDARLDAHVAQTRARVADPGDTEHTARRLVQDLALALQGSLLVRFAPPAVADAFCASRLSGEPAFTFGTLPSGVDTHAIVDRARPML
ncbi:MAG: isovaleryl-CoA dehydrogenase [Acidimicrobiia bacterium]